MVQTTCSEMDSFSNLDLKSSLAYIHQLTPECNDATDVSRCEIKLYKVMCKH